MLEFIWYVIVCLMLCLFSEKTLDWLTITSVSSQQVQYFPTPSLFTRIFFFVSCFFHSYLDWYKHWVMVVINQSGCADFNFQPCSSLILTTLSLNAVLVWLLSSSTHDGPWCVFYVQHLRGCWRASFLLEYKNCINNNKEKSRERKKKRKLVCQSWERKTVH